MGAGRSSDLARTNLCRTEIASADECFMIRSLIRETVGETWEAHEKHSQIRVWIRIDVWPKVIEVHKPSYNIQIITFC